MPSEDSDPADIAPISRDHLVTELEYDDDFVVLATRIVVEHRVSGQIELWRDAAPGDWKVVQASSSTPRVLNWTTGRFEDLSVARDDDAHRFLMPLSEAQLFAYRLLQGWARQPSRRTLDWIDMVDDEDE